MHILMPIQKAIHKFRARPWTYLMIPVIAALVGWFTNWLAVQMIFYPIQFRGIPFYRVNDCPLGFIGWQGIVPCKTQKMSEVMVHMVTTQLLNVHDVFMRLDPKVVAKLLGKEMPRMIHGVFDDISVPICSPLRTLSTISSTSFIYEKLLRTFTIKMQENINSVLNLRNCVVNQMMMDRSLLGTLFQKCGQKELEFLTNSGLWFGFFLGIIQMVVALFWENPWSLSIGGAIVGYATNWLALKWIFEPVNPTRFGPFILQGQFLRRQREVAKEFSTFFASKILTSEQLWTSILTDPVSSPAFMQLFTDHVNKFTNGLTLGLPVVTNTNFMRSAISKAVHRLPNHVHVLHSYVNDKLMLENTLKTSMEQMTSVQFERVLHPIFEEDELTLIIAGGVLGFAAGLIQQGIETGKIKLLGPKELLDNTKVTMKKVLVTVRKWIQFRNWNKFKMWGH
jgi:uncharacterized membrane protein YheB (UPF0754 family)